MFARDGQAWLVIGSLCAPWSFEGYGDLQPLPSVPVAVLTPDATLKALAQGYRPVRHESLRSRL